MVSLPVSTAELEAVVGLEAPPLPGGSKAQRSLCDPGPWVFICQVRMMMFTVGRVEGDNVCADPGTLLVLQTFMPC